MSRRVVCFTRRHFSWRLSRRRPVRVVHAAPFFQCLHNWKVWKSHTGFWEGLSRWVGRTRMPTFAMKSVTSFLSFNQIYSPVEEQAVLVFAISSCFTHLIYHSVVPLILTTFYTADAYWRHQIHNQYLWTNVAKEKSVQLCYMYFTRCGYCRLSTILKLVGVISHFLVGYIFHVCSFIVLVTWVTMYNVNSLANERKTFQSEVCVQTFACLCTCVHMEACVHICAVNLLFWKPVMWRQGFRGLWKNLEMRVFVLFVRGTSFKTRCCVSRDDLKSSEIQLKLWEGWSQRVWRNHMLPRPQSRVASYKWLVAAALRNYHCAQSRRIPSATRPHGNIYLIIVRTRWTWVAFAAWKCVSNWKWLRLLHS